MGKNKRRRNNAQAAATDNLQEPQSDTTSMDPKLRDSAITETAEMYQNDEDQQAYCI